MLVVVLEVVKAQMQLTEKVVVAAVLEVIELLLKQKEMLELP